MLAVIEGPDGAGKTTLIEKLRRTSDRYFWVIRPSRPPRELRQIMEVLAWVRRRGPGVDVLMDRHPAVSEPIYGPLFRQKNLLEKMPHSLLLDNVDLIIYCRPPLETILANVYRTREYQMAGVTDRTTELVQAYDEKMVELGKSYHVHVYDYTTMDASMVCDLITLHPGAPTWKTQIPNG